MSRSAISRRVRRQIIIARDHARKKASRTRLIELGGQQVLVDPKGGLTVMPSSRAAVAGILTAIRKEARIWKKLDARGIIRLCQNPDTGWRPLP